MGEGESIKPSGEKSEQERINEKNAEMERLVERTRRFGLPYSIARLELGSDRNIGDRYRRNARKQLQEAENLSDSNSNKSRQIQIAKETLEMAESFEERTQKTLDFLRSIKAGQMPENWLEIPEWHYGCPLEGVYRNAVVRNNMACPIILKQAGIDPEQATEEQIMKTAKDFEVSENPYLLEMAKRGEIKNYDIEGNPFIEQSSEE